MDKKALFQTAWTLAREAATRLGTAVRAQFAPALKAAWAAAKAPVAVPVMFDREMAVSIVKDAAERLGLRVRCNALCVLDLFRKSPGLRNEASRVLARQGFHREEASLVTGVVNSLRRDGETLADNARRNVRAAEALVALRTV